MSAVRRFNASCPDCGRWRCHCGDGCPDCGSFASPCDCDQREQRDAYYSALPVRTAPAPAAAVRTGPPPAAVRARLAELRAEFAK